jgi:hypothetical protein
VEPASSRRRIVRGILAIAGGGVAALVVVYGLRWYRVTAICDGFLSLEPSHPKSPEGTWSALDMLGSRVEVFRAPGSSVGDCRETLTTYARHSSSGSSCLVPCSEKKERANALRCAEACVKADAELEAARRAAQRNKQAEGREWILGAASAPTERVSGKVRQLSLGEERTFAVELPQGGQLHPDADWSFDKLGTVVPVWVRLRLERTDSRSLRETATLGEKTTRLSDVSEKTDAGRYVLARVGPSYEFSRDWLTATFRDRLVVQVLWNLDEKIRVECRVEVGLLDLEDRHVDAGIAWAEKVCGSARFTGPG